MSIHKEGYKILFFGFLVLALLNVVVGILWPGLTLFRWGFLIFSLLLYIFLLFFFRLPERKIEPVHGLVYSPADGKVVVIEETFEKEYFRDTRLQISIFMSPFNMHSNRYPVSGTVKYVSHSPGRNIVAWHPKSSELNERTSVVIETPDGKEILVRQIAGAVARRIVTYAKRGQAVQQGDELGFIKFGSRVDIFLPVGTEVEVPLLQHVRANKSIIARL
ncbi:MAG TPA: phosphatidylserine decarboxylase family protein [Bacteroidales bacterium]|nr:phosphatidylserine decarboxylase family protein [Bacteroidales bacterium]HOK73668.1 phosphatidylserine decarboxylase family protein [Bacteroidales bacterium]HOM39336.1 phosphatidylserine decarboxylase family protein [Bacteroidales bacterium]HPP91444.1 phosphatidylserine decarboxylase family protein [Bacteroidales bacterium]HQG56466.1 phosphatidylserine decarboxylase family protein [Bacteroidales bacterium]